MQRGVLSPPLLFIALILAPSLISGLPRYLLSQAVSIPSSIFMETPVENGTSEMLFLCILLSEDHSVLMPVYMVAFYILPVVLLLSLSLALKCHIKRKQQK